MHITWKLDTYFFGYCNILREKINRVHRIGRMGSSSSNDRTGASDQDCSLSGALRMQNQDLEFTSLSLGRWIIYEDSATHQLRFAWGNRDWCLAFTPEGDIQIQMGNKLKGAACWTGDPCASSTWCTSYQEPKKKTWYKACKTSSAYQIRNRETKLGALDGKMMYADRIKLTDRLNGKTIEVYEDYSNYNLDAQSEDASYSRPQLVFAYNRKPQAVIDPTSLNERVMNKTNSEGKPISGVGRQIHSFNNSSDPDYLAVLSFEGHNARAHDTTYTVSSVPKVYKSPRSTDVVRTIQTCHVGLQLSPGWSMRAALDPTRPGTLWFAYDSNKTSSSSHAYTKAIGIDTRQSDVIEHFDGDIVVSQKDWGQYISCPKGYAVVRFCGSGKDHNCSSGKGMGRITMAQHQAGVNPVSQILCRNLDRIPSGEAAAGIPEIGGRTSTSTWYMHNEWIRKCPSNSLLTGVCTSGENSDCPKVDPNGSIVDSNSRYRGAIQCSSYKNGSLGSVSIGTDQGRSVQGYFTSAMAPKSTAAVGVCNGGRNASDCPGNVFGKLYYANVSLSSLSSPESVTSNLHSGSLGKYLLSRVNQSERARVRQALGAPADTVFADQLGWCNDPREKCNPALGTTVEYQPWEKRINVYETSDVTKIKPVTDPNRTVWRYNGVGKALTKLSSASSSNSPPSASPNNGVLSAPANILKQMGPGWYLGDKNGTVQAQIHTFARASSGKNATIALTASLNAGNYRIYNASKQNTGFDSNFVPSA